MTGSGQNGERCLDLVELIKAPDIFKCDEVNFVGAVIVKGAR